jgi:hypothetical protein
VTHVRLELGPSATYTRRVALWVPSVGTGDGALVLTVYVPKQMPHSSCYWVDTKFSRSPTAVAFHSRSMTVRAVTKILR